MTATPEVVVKGPERDTQIQERQAASDREVVGITGAEILALGVGNNKVVTDCSIVGDDGLICVFIGS